MLVASCSVQLGIFRRAVQVQQWRVLKRVPKLLDEDVGKDVSKSGSMRQLCDDLNGAFHDHRLVILDPVVLDLSFKNVVQSLEVWGKLLGNEPP